MNLLIYIFLSAEVQTARKLEGGQVMLAVKLPGQDWQAPDCRRNWKTESEQEFRL